MSRSRFVCTCARASLTACVAIISAALFAVPGSAQAASTVKVAFFNIQSGKGEAAFAGRTAPFVESLNCTDTAAPLNAWGMGFLQRELTAKLGNDPSVIALGLAEAWFCGSPENVRRALNWKSRSEERNGLAIVARHGFSGPVTFLQLDTSLSTSTEPRHIMHAPVCVDAACSATFDVFAIHTAAGGTYRVESMVRQMEQVVAFTTQHAGHRPRALVGDFNVHEEMGPPCSSSWPSRILDVLRHRGWVDAWRAIHGTTPGYTGMTNRVGCGSPEGSPYKRIDYAWSLNAPPLSMTRFAKMPPGEATYSDHVGIIAEYPINGVPPLDVTGPVSAISTPTEGAAVAGIATVSAKATDAGPVLRVDFLADGALLASDTVAPFSASWDTRRLANGIHTLQARATDAAGNMALSSMRTVTVANPMEPPSTSQRIDEVVLHASTASVAGRWQMVSDTSAASGRRLYTANLGAAKATAASAHPSSYADMKFYAEKGKPYRLWLRGRADGNSWRNDSAFVQFSDAVTGNGAPVWRIGSTSAMTVSIEAGTGAGLSGWGWASNMYGGLGPLVSFATSGEHTIRIQIREDGMSIDQVVLSAAAYMTNAPGATKNDVTILASPKPPTMNTREIVMRASKAAAFGSWRVMADASAAGGSRIWNPNAAAAKLGSAQAAPRSYIELTFTADRGTPYRLWLRGRAEEDSWANDSVFVQFSDAVDGSGAAVWRIGSASSTWVSLEECSGCAVSGWSWQDNGYGYAGTMGPLVRFATSGTHTIRIQVREDGISLDQIVLSAERYLTASPGASKDDTTVLPRW
jgi:exonuclease III